MYFIVRRAPYHPSPSLRPWDRPELLGANRWADLNRHGTRIRQRSVPSSRRKRALVRSPSSRVRAAPACRRELVAHRGDLHVLRRRGKVGEGERRWEKGERGVLIEAIVHAGNDRSSRRTRSRMRASSTLRERGDATVCVGPLWPEAFVSFCQSPDRG